MIVAAYNEEDAIEVTLERIAATTYDGPIEVVLADNNSTDRTAELAEAVARRHGLDYRRSFEPLAGKHHALNTALEIVTTPLVVTLDADTRLHRDALTYLIARVTTRPQDQHVCACAGALIVENATSQLPHPDAELGLPARDQRRQAHPGGLQQRPRGPRSVLGLLGR